MADTPVTVLAFVKQGVIKSSAPIFSRADGDFLPAASSSALVEMRVLCFTCVWAGAQSPAAVPSCSDQSPGYSWICF